MLAGAVKKKPADARRTAPRRARPLLRERFPCTSPSSAAVALVKFDELAQHPHVRRRGDGATPDPTMPLAPSNNAPPPADARRA